MSEGFEAAGTANALSSHQALAQFVVVLVLVAVAAGAWLFWRAMPEYSGTAALPGLTAETRVWRDQYGVPHIFAATMNDAARALGWLHASERLYQMEIQRRVGQGRIAEIAGPDLIGVDRFIRTLGLYRLAESSFAALSPFAQARLRPMSTASTRSSIRTPTPCRRNS